MQRKSGRIAAGAMGAALVMIATAWVKIPVPGGAGYAHVGDGMIFACAAVLGPQAAWAAGIGSALADVLAGYPVYVPLTFFIKAVMGYLAGRYAVGGAGRRAAVFIGAEALMAAGYFAFDCVLYGVAPALAALPFSLFVQGGVGIALGLALSGRRVQTLGRQEEQSPGKRR